MNIKINKFPKIRPIDVLKNVIDEVILYSPVYGTLRFKRIDNGMFTYPIICELINPQGNAEEIAFTEEGKLINLPDAECVLFPSKNEYNWIKQYICKYGEPVMYLEQKTDVIWALGTNTDGNKVMCDNGTIIEVFCKISVKDFDFKSRIKIVE